MSKGPRIRPRIKDVITHEARQDPGESRSDVVARLNPIITDLGEPLPQPETLMRAISWARNRPIGQEDESWTLGALTRFPLPAEAIPAVLGVWKWRLAQGAPFSIREAKWAARLRCLFPHTWRLSRWAGRFAARELESEAEKKVMNTPDLDLAVTMRPWEWATLYFMGRTKVRPSREHQATLPAGSTGEEVFGGSVEVRADGEVRGQMMLQEMVRTEGSRQSVVDRVGPPKEFRNEDLSTQAKWVYAYWLFYLAQGPRWEGLPLEERVRIIEQLQEWTDTHPWAQLLPEEMAFAPDEAMDMDCFAPHHLLRQVGYEA